MVNEQSVEAWAHSHRFSEPLRLAEVEAGVLARNPAANTGIPWWVAAIGATGWLSMALVYLIGPGVAVTGLAMVWVAGRDDPPGGTGFWMNMTQLVFGVGALAYAFRLAEVVRAGQRKTFDLVAALLTVTASAVSLLLLRSMTSDAVPLLAWTAVLALGVLGSAVGVASLVSKPRERKRAKTKPPPRGPAAEREYDRYMRTRERVLGIVVGRGLLKMDEIEQGRLNAMPLGYWDELDNVDERERRRILEYAVIGWREFDDRDRRSWSPPANRD